ncbi:MAG: right-handed parallel beta-helix repeat-containing protein, partial [Clostridiales bacterium]|nr:right-handed parallel beta-helix repeat-containing protein [Clostridiales bacterium]
MLRGKQKVSAFILAVSVLSTNILPGFGAIGTVQAASAYEAVEQENLVSNAGFEENEQIAAHMPDDSGEAQSGAWYFDQTAERTEEAAHSGTWAGKLSADGALLEQNISGLVVGMTYTMEVWARLSGEDGDAKYFIGIKNDGEEDRKLAVASTDWQLYTLDFVYTGRGDARIFACAETAGTIAAYVDDISLKAKGDIQSAIVRNGQLEVTFSDAYAGTPSADRFSATCSVDGKPGIALALTDGTVNGKTLSMSFAPVEATTVEQSVTVSLSYDNGQMIREDYNSGQTITLDYTVPAKEKGEEQNAAEALGSVRTSEGLAENEDIGTKAAVDMTSAAVYKSGAASTTYYVSSTEGNDTYSGTSPDKPFATIDHLNTLTFSPGDKILFKKGDTFIGWFKPKGSGTEQAPIEISSYGTGAKPILQPDPNKTETIVMMSGGGQDTNAKTNYVIQFLNVQYWEVRGLHIMDPNSEKYLNPSDPLFVRTNPVYRSGITIQAADYEPYEELVLDHFVIENCEIHGFHGPLTNLGKTAGGITMNVLTEYKANNADYANSAKKMQINGIQILNNEIYDVGRSGINFLNVWSARTDDSKWGSSTHNNERRGLEWTPYENFVLRNNYIHNIDGDGVIVDNCKDAIVEYNLVQNCVEQPTYHDTTATKMAVGMFNWNSDNTIFQYNEVFGTQLGDPGHTYYPAADAQGIEIDALNDVTYVQYNYLHDNKGGFMMYCNLDSTTQSYKGIVRYNISQNDYAHPQAALFDIIAWNHGTEIYNNTIYLTNRSLNAAGEVFMFDDLASQDTIKFYNNIFYYDSKNVDTQASYQGNGQAPAINKFADNAVDWRSNIFYGFSESRRPVDDDPKFPNLYVDPKLAAP